MTMTIWRATCLASTAAIMLACGTVTEDDGKNGEQSPPDVCVPASCEDLGFECGSHDDGCAGLVTCPGCDEGFDCEQGICVEEPEPPCEPETCESLGVLCGAHDDGCGVELDCGPCGVCPDEPLCFAPERGQPDAAAEVVTGAVPSLAGGELFNGWYELESLGFYTDQFISSMAQVTITSNGNTHGGIELLDDQWGLHLHLHVSITVSSALTGAMTQPFTGAVDLGGCFEVVANRIVGDILQCGGRWLDDSDPPDGLSYQSEQARLQLLVTMDRQAFIDQLPAEYQQYGPMLFTGDLPILMTFSR